ncbi:MAG: hypothetical protein AB7D38_12395 [Sulfurimonas sp.]|jgi:hypothetical protein|uniref:hypothetical protein n=1 Tax=Sulfurimonas sp. TaxID=2022749 RepID=UPI003D132B86
MSKEDVEKIEKKLVDELLNDPEGDIKFKRNVANITKGLFSAVANLMDDESVIKTDKEYDEISESIMYEVLKEIADKKTLQ